MRFSVAVCAAVLVSHIYAQDPCERTATTCVTANDLSSAPSVSSVCQTLPLAANATDVDVSALCPGLAAGATFTWFRVQGGGGRLQAALSDDTVTICVLRGSTSCSNLVTVTQNAGSVAFDTKFDDTYFLFISENNATPVNFQLDVSQADLKQSTNIVGMFIGVFLASLLILYFVLKYARIWLNKPRREGYTAAAS